MRQHRPGAADAAIAGATRAQPTTGACPLVTRALWLLSALFGAFQVMLPRGFLSLIFFLHCDGQALSCECACFNASSHFDLDQGQSRPFRYDRVRFPVEADGDGSSPGIAGARRLCLLRCSNENLRDAIKP